MRLRFFVALLCLCILTPPVDLRSKEDPAEVERLVIGEAEYFYISEAGARYNARIDTGATTSSIHALDIEAFERDGETWVSFTLIQPESGKAVELEKPVERIASIRRRGGEESMKRYVVKLEATLGNWTRRYEFNLADRTDFEFPLLIGRNLLRGTLIVDVSVAYTQTKQPKPKQ